MTNDKECRSQREAFTQYVWLIEKGDRAAPEYLYFDGMFEWTKDAYKALWFIRRKDADAVGGECSKDVSVVKHGFDIEQSRLLDDKGLAEKVAWAITNADIEFRSTATIPHWARHLTQAAIAEIKKHMEGV